MTELAKPKKRIELTVRALILGCLLAVIFTAANVYLGLQVGLTFASSIPAAVISMALLRMFKTSTIWENMTVQTVASVGGAISSIIFVLPALVMVGWWTGDNNVFDYSGRGNHGALQNGPIFAAGMVKNACRRAPASTQRSSSPTSRYLNRARFASAKVFAV